MHLYKGTSGVVGNTLTSTAPKMKYLRRILGKTMRDKVRNRSVREQLQLQLQLGIYKMEKILVFWSYDTDE